LIGLAPTIPAINGWAILGNQAVLAGSDEVKSFRRHSMPLPFFYHAETKERGHWLWGNIIRPPKIAQPFMAGRRTQQTCKSRQGRKRFDSIFQPHFLNGSFVPAGLDRLDAPIPAINGWAIVENRTVLSRPPKIAQPFMAGRRARQTCKSRQGRKRFKFNISAAFFNASFVPAGLDWFDAPNPSHKWLGYSRRPNFGRDFW
jgi:hypothetical protein